jgi:hypothetical protein
VRGRARALSSDSYGRLHCTGTRARRTPPNSLRGGTIRSRKVLAGAPARAARATGGDGGGGQWEPVPATAAPDARSLSFVRFSFRGLTLTLSQASCIPQSHPHHTSLIRLDGGLDVADEHPRGVEAHRAHHEEEGEGDVGHLAEVEGRLKEARHARVVEVVEKALELDEDADHAAREERAPPPAVVLRRELELRQCDDDEGRHDREERKGEEEDALERVDLRGWE